MDVEFALIQLGQRVINPLGGKPLQEEAAKHERAVAVVDIALAVRTALVDEPGIHLVLAQIKGSVEMG